MAQTRDVCGRFYRQSRTTKGKPATSWIPTSSSSSVYTSLTMVHQHRQRLFNLRRLKKFGLAPKTLTNFYRCTMESMLLGCITARYSNCTPCNRRVLQRVVRFSDDTGSLQIVVQEKDVIHRVWSLTAGFSPKPHIHLKVTR